MKLLILFLFGVFTGANNQEIASIREQYHQAIYEEKAAVDLSKAMGLIQNKSTLELAYQGATQMLLAKYAFLPNQKYSNFISGKALLEQAILKEPSNIELIYLRYGIQLNAPSFLSYQQNLEADKMFLIEHVKAVADKDLHKRILVLLLAQGKLTDAERKLLQ
ncbi:MAG: hypothetical protein K9H61_13680 [Bacteroidia bacterium]|nr:hypothetical protein [Bacteroidia bacterium]MCF8426592.1 hypothetical protein [Bacteroidia bacterium]MCF8448035.1 hypothetical protein [Bacteroidia bacterium]